MNTVAALVVTLGVFWAQPLPGEEVYDTLSRDYLDIESDNPIEEGEDFEYWDEGSRTYHTGTVVEAGEDDLYDGTFRVLDDASGDIRTFDLED